MRAGRPERRDVFVLGRNASLEIGPVVGRVARTGSVLILMVVGRRVTAEQGRVVGEAVRLSAELGVALEAAWVFGAAEAREVIRQDDAVTVVASPRERARLERLLGLG